jgi:hypothetical protein
MDKGTYMAVSPAAVIPGALPDFRIYVRTAQGTYSLWALEGNKVTTAQLARLSEGGHREIYVDLEEQFKYEQYLEDHLGHILENKAASDDQKAQIFSKVSTNVVKGAFEASLGLGTMDNAALDRTRKLIENALAFITESKSLQALTKLIGHDYQTYEHATKVLWLTVAFLRGREEILEQIVPGYESRDENEKKAILQQCAVGALLHDIGKVFVAHEILEKSGPLTEVEWEIMKRHPLNGLAMLIDTQVPVYVRKAVLHHHEDFRGGGYPMGFEGEQITPLGRVLRIIDVFDAMTSRRPYKDPMPPMKAARIMIGAPAGPAQGGTIPADERDQGMQKCFDEALLKKFIVFLGDVKLGG